MKPLLTKFITSLLFIITSSTLFAQSLVPYLTFGSNGKTISNYAKDASTFNSCIALQPGGKMIIGGNAIVRVLPDGLPDITYNTMGFYFDPAMNKAPQSITERAGIVTALYNDFDTSVTFKRLNPDGVPDNNYGDSGLLTYGLPGLKLNGYKNILQDDGKMLLIGSASQESNTNVFVARFLQNGLPDTSFNYIGYLIMPFAGANSFATTAAIQSNGNIIVTGVYSDNNTAVQKLFAVRINPNGIVDNSFNTTGIFFSNGTGSGSVSPKTITIQPDDKILIAGNAADQIMVIRLKEDGSADESFNGTGTLFSYIGQFNNPSGIFVRPNKKIVVSAETEISVGDPSNWNYGAIQLLEDGSPDNSFSGNGKMYVSISVQDHCVGAVLQNDGRLIFTGYADQASLITMVAIDTTGEVDFNFGSGGIKILQLLGSNDKLFSLLQRTDKKIIAIGTKGQGQLDKSNIILMRYKQNGTLDSSFGFNGKTGISRDNTTLLDAGIQQTGKIIACGIIYDENVFAYRKTIFRFTEDGFPDFTFAPATNFLYPGETALSIPATKDMLVYDDDKILFGQNNADVDGNMSVTRLTADGEPDIFFGNNGTKVLSIPGGNYTFSNICLQTDKKILIAAKKKIDDYNTGYCIIRLTENGDFDNSFDEDGIKELPFTSQIYGENFDLCLAVQYGQKITVGTTVLVHNGADYDTSITVMQLKNNGDADLSFNQTGIVNIASVDNKRNILQSIAAYPDAGLYLNCNRLVSSTEQKAFLMKLTPQGKLDSTITSNGYNKLFIYNPGNSQATDLKILEDSTILFGGNLFNGSNDNDFLLAAYKARTVNVYKFIGDGDWTDTANWENNTVPPAILPSNGFIFVQPVTGGKCVLNIDQQIQQGSCLVVLAGKNLIINGNLTIH